MLSPTTPTADRTGGNGPVWSHRLLWRSFLRSDPLGADDRPQEGLWEADNAGEPASCHRQARLGGQPVAGRLWTTQYEGAQTNQPHMF